MTAWGYANNAYGGGELGTTAYNLIIGAEALKEECWESDGLLKEDVARIKETALIAPAPVLLIFKTEELDLQGLKSISGGDITVSDSQLFRYIKPVDFSKDPFVKNLPVGIDPYNTDPDELLDMVNGKEQ